ncbi:MAG: DUF4114 domain-containing protein [Lewinellaceae bacterium]|nr:DUF4114 domain-containing protein [Saprospiraceae bacterium]MCB9336895.1 DUF4114 domain-containing protein [Lewinellaceae bacterium]
MQHPAHTQHLFLASLLTLFVLSCQRENLQEQSPVKDDYGYLEINTQPDAGRIQQANQLVVWKGNGLKKEGISNHQLDDRGGEGSPDDDMYWLHIGDVTPLEYQGHALSATHVVVKDNFAYVSYHARGEDHLGAVEAVDLTDPELPVVVSQAFFSTADVNAIEVDQDAPASDTRLWVALSDAKKGAVLGQLSVQYGLFGNSLSYANLSNALSSGIASSANSIEHAGDFLYVTAGKSNGGVYLFDASDLHLIGNTSFNDAKYVVANGRVTGTSKVVTLQAGVSSFLRVETLGQFGFGAEVSIGEIAHQKTDAGNFGKSTLHFQADGSEIVYVAMGTGGVKAFDISNGIREVWASPADMIVNGNCNGVTTANGFLYAANGADGLAVFQLVDNEDPNLVFVWDLEAEGASVNFVETAGNFVFVAKGQGGLKILKRPESGDLLPLAAFNGNGTPLQLAAEQEVCETLLTSLYTQALPETQNAQNNHPEFFAPDITHNIVLEERCEVLVTFINEVAGYKNSLGYYYYDVNNPPATLDDLTKIIVFPNASAVGSGGELVPGNTMELLGTFNENTVIGFFLISDGWRDGRVTNGNYTLYSNPLFNPDNRVQSLIFHDETCSSTVLCFEDILTTGGDKDFNDVIFQVTTSPPSAINSELYIQL